MVTVGDAATHNEKEVKTRYPVEEGLTAGTQKQTGRVTNMIPQGLNGVVSRVASRTSAGV